MELSRIAVGLVAFFVVTIVMAEGKLSKKASIPDFEKRIQKDAYPVLKSGQWRGLDQGVLSKSIIGSKEDPKLVTVFGYETAESIVYLTSGNKGNIDTGKVVKQAYKNLDSMVVDFTLSKALDNKVLTASGKTFSSEAILSQVQMLKAHKILKAEEIVVSIARSTGLMIMDKNASKEIRKKFIYLHNVAWNEDDYGNAKIINSLFVLKNGEIIRAIPMEKGA